MPNRSYGNGRRWRHAAIVYAAARRSTRPKDADIAKQVRARIDERAAAALKKIGLTVSDAFRLLLVRVAAEKALPFEPLNPNNETVAAMKAARRGELVSVGKPDKLLRSLNEGS
jgi:DNA-damage-inducible protein J